MIQLIIILLGICFIFQIFRDLGFDIPTFILAGLMTTVMIIVLACIACFCESFFSKEYAKEEAICSIYSMNTISGVQGTFRLGTGYIGTTQNYFYFYKDNRGALCKGALPSDSVKIFTDENNNPYISWQIFYKKVPNWIWIYPTLRSRENSYYDVHIPTNSVVLEFKVN